MDLLLHGSAVPGGLLITRTDTQDWRPGLFSARAVQISWLRDFVGLILLVKMRVKLVLRNQVEVDGEKR
jgi:hypothetical protein